MNCCDVGIPSPHTAGQVAKHKEVPTGVPVYLPTGVINPIPMSKQVLTNPVPTPLNPISFFSGKIKSSFGRLFKKRKDKTNKKEVWRTGLTWHFVYDGKETGARCVHTWGDKDLYNHRLNFLGKP